MLKQTLNRFLRAPFASLGVILLAAVLAASLCALHAANEAEQARYDETMENMEIHLIVTNLSGTRSDGLEAPTWVEKFFNSRLTENGVFGYVKDVQVQYTMELESVLLFTDAGYQGSHNLKGEVVGITGLSGTPEIDPGNIQWLPGYDEGIFQGKQNYCVLPRELMPENWDGKTPVNVIAACTYEGTWGMEGTSFDLLVVGTQSVSSGRIFIPGGYFKNYNAEIDRIQATLIDNSLVDQVRELASHWFAEPNPTGEKTPWDYSYYFWYPYALKIDTDQIILAERTLKISILINELCSVLVFALSAGASFFVGFLMIRSRKREIALMRTLGTRPVSIFAGLALEQLICLGAGIALGGAFFGFQPMERLGAFAGVYFTGLCAALIIFLSSNLMSTLKEDE